MSYNEDMSPRNMTDDVILLTEAFELTCLKFIKDLTSPNKFREVGMYST